MDQQMDEQLPECAKEWLELLKMMEQQDDPRYTPTLLMDEDVFSIGDASVFSEEPRDAVVDVVDYLRDAARNAADDLEDE